MQVLAQGTNGDRSRRSDSSCISRMWCFLDVQMPGLDGPVVLMKLLDKKTDLPQVVFATAFDQYTVRAFEVNAVGLLAEAFRSANGC